MVIRSPFDPKARLLIQQYPARAGSGESGVREALEGLSGDAHDGTAAQYRDAVGTGDQRRTLDAGRCTCQRDDGLLYLGCRALAGGAGHPAGLPQPAKHGALL